MRLMCFVTFAIKCVLKLRGLVVQTRIGYPTRIQGYKDTRIQGYKDTRIQGYKSDNYFIEFTIVIILK